jgi:riboflavin-specific deaminase-like protein
LVKHRGVKALWPLCLEIAQRRRRGAPAVALATPGGALDWRAGHGYALQGDWDAEATQQFALLKPLLDLPSEGPPWAIGQLGQSLDGFVATESGDANFVNGQQVLVHLHRLRALCDAVLIGAGTAAIDNPQLTTRRVSGPNAVRVVLDPGLRVPPAARLFNDDLAPTLLVCDAARKAEAAARLGADRVLAMPRLGDTSFDLAALQATLHGRGLRVLFVEGGGITVSRFIAQGRLDRLHLSVAPVLIGGGRPGLALPRAATMKDALRPDCRTFALGGDMLWDLVLR